jgi:hypothetical protein
MSTLYASATWMARQLEDAEEERDALKTELAELKDAVQDELRYTECSHEGYDPACCTRCRLVALTNEQETR